MVNVEQGERFSAEVLVDDAGAGCLVLHGEVDVATAPTMAAAFRELVEQGPSRITIDCGDLSFLDSSGIRVLEQAWLDLRDRATMPVALVDVQPVVCTVLRACGQGHLVP